MQVSGFNNSFASGEIAPDAWERGDLAQAQTGCEAALNFLGLTTGPNVSRGGMLRRGAPKYVDRPHRLFTWLRSDGEGLVLEFGPLYGRVWTARGVLLEASPGVPYEFAHTYSDADLPHLRLSQVGDVGYVTARTGILNQVVRRLADTNWEVSHYPLRDGPFLAENEDLAHTLTLTDNMDDTWSVVASQPTFLPGHVGASFRIRAESGSPGLRTWAPNTAFIVERVISGGRVYQAAAPGTSGNTAPSHDRGLSSDGGVTWQFIHDGAAEIYISAVADATHATALVPSELPLGSGDATSNWSEGAFSGVRGFPTALSAVREERLCLAGTPDQPDVVHLSRTAGFTPTFGDFKPGLGTGLVVDDDACRIRLGAKRARIVWMVDALNLAVGTTDAEYVVSGVTVDDPISPASINAGRPLSGYGSADVMPVVLQGPPLRLLHVARGGTTLRELTMNGGSVQAEGRDLSLLAQHVFGRGVVDMAWSRPDNNLWLLLADQTLACFTYHYEHNIMGVRRQPMAGGWLAEGIATAPDPDGRDRLHVSAVRFKNAVLQRAHFVLAERSSGIFMDCAEQYAGAPVTTVGGLSHLEGETVAVFADGAYVGDQAVVGGAVTLAAPASAVTVGLKMLRRFRSLPPDWTRDAAMAARKTRPLDCYVVFGGVICDVGAEANDEPGEAVALERIDGRRPGDVNPVVRRQRHKVGLGAGADRDVRVVVQTDAPFDLQVYALRPVGDTA